MKIAYIFMFLILLNTCLAVSLKNKEITEEKVETQTKVADGLGGDTPKVTLQTKDYENQVKVMLRTNIPETSIYEEQNGLYLHLLNDSWEEENNTKLVLNEKYKDYMFETTNLNQYLIPFRFIKTGYWHYGGYSTTNKQSFFRLQPDDGKDELTIYFLSKYHNWQCCFSYPEEMNKNEIERFANKMVELGGAARQEIISLKTDLKNYSSSYSETQSLIQQLKNNNDETKRKFLEKKDAEIANEEANLKTLGEKKTTVEAEYNKLLEDNKKLAKDFSDSVEKNEADLKEKKKVYDEKQTEFVENANKIKEAQAKLKVEEDKNKALKTKYESTKLKFDSTDLTLQKNKTELENQLKEINKKIEENAKKITDNNEVKKQVDEEKKTWMLAVVGNEMARKVQENLLKDLESKNKEYNDKYQAELEKSNKEQQKELETKQNKLDVEKEKEQNKENELKLIITEINEGDNKLNNLKQTKNNLTGLTVESVSTQEQKLETTQNSYNDIIRVLNKKIQSSARTIANGTKNDFNTKVGNLSKISPRTSATTNITGNGTATQKAKRKMKMKK